MTNGFESSGHKRYRVLLAFSSGEDGGGLSAAKVQPLFRVSVKRSIERQ